MAAPQEHPTEAATPTTAQPEAATARAIDWRMETMSEAELAALMERKY